MRVESCGGIRCGCLCGAKRGFRVALGRYRLRLLHLGRERTLLRLLLSCERRTCACLGRLATLFRFVESCFELLAEVLKHHIVVLSRAVPACLCAEETAETADSRTELLRYARHKMGSWGNVHHSWGASTFYDLEPSALRRLIRALLRRDAIRHYGEVVMQE